VIIQQILKKTLPRIVLAVIFTVIWYYIQVIMETPANEGGPLPDFRLSPAPALAFAAVVYAASAWFNYLRMDKGIMETLHRYFNFGRRLEDERFKKDMKMRMNAAKQRATGDESAEATEEGDEKAAPGPAGEDEAAREDAKQKIAANLAAAGFLAVLTFVFVR
jgi:hypothetical protein